ncbi:MAG: hypothetical protein K6G26_06540 [Lachnospiraceae bacterium]|nr:hypothetical protein [Lachnospiraceae bacterium]
MSENILYINSEQMKHLCRYEIKYSELLKNYDYVLLSESYVFTIDDMLAAIENIKESGDDIETLYEEWFEPLDKFICTSDEYRVGFENSPYGFEEIDNLPDRYDYLSDIFDEFNNALYEHAEEHCTLDEAIEYAMSCIEQCLDNEKKPVGEREYFDQYKKEFLEICEEEEISETDISLCRKFADELSNNEDVTGLKFKAYGYYYGSECYEVDYDKAYEYLIKLYNITGERDYAQLLGDLYYNGICTDGKPDYDMAFKYYSVGMLGESVYSKYKVAEMLSTGKGVVKNIRSAYKIVRNVYEEEWKDFLKSYEILHFGASSFAKAALELGIYEEGLKKYDEAYRCYLQAEFAIGLILHEHFKEYEELADKIRKRIDRLKLAPPKKNVRIPIWSILRGYLRTEIGLQLNIHKLDDGNIKLSMSQLPKRAIGREKLREKLFVTEIETGFCGLLDTVDFIFEDAIVVIPDNINEPVVFNDIATCHEDYGHGIDFYLYNKLTARIIGKYYFRHPDEQVKKQYNMITFYNDNMRLFVRCITEIEDLSAGDDIYIIGDKERFKRKLVDVRKVSESELCNPVEFYMNYKVEKIY